MRKSQPSLASIVPNHKTMSPLLLYAFSFILCSSLSLSPATAQHKVLSSFTLANSPWRSTDTSRILVSPNRTFAAGFRNSSFSIWVRSAADKAIVWTLRNSANVSIPGVSVSTRGDLSVTNKNFSVDLKEDGSLVAGNWSSFSNPTNTILADQPLLLPTSSVSLQSSSGRYRLINATTLVFIPTGEVYWSASSIIRNLTYNGTLNVDGTNNNLIAADGGKSVLRRLTLEDGGNLRLYSLNSTTGLWNLVWQAVQELCMISGRCSPPAICVPQGASDDTRCVCPPGYKNSSSGGCSIKTPLANGGGKFLRLDFVQYRWSSARADLLSTDLDLCQNKCLGNSSCRGFGYKFDGSQNCTHLIGNLTEAYWSPGSEVATFIRVGNSEKDNSTFTGMVSRINTVCPVRLSLPLPPKETKTTARNISIIVVLFAVELAIGGLSFRAFLMKYSKYADMARTLGLELLPAGGPKRFSYAELKSATKDFSTIVGHGGFGVVYKGELSDGRIVAVKKLKNVSRGEADFWAEVTIIGRMHHLNLVRMWGFCAEKGHRMLVYEYVGNGSLDKYLFSSSTANDRNNVKPILELSMRYRIAIGVARAIAYLHEECLEWVLHCDIKPENILIGEDFCPKVSDFGLSKLASKEDQVTMSKIRGTRGYMAPEWVLHSQPITAKADVYSFGMVLLEMVTGVRNSEFQRESLESDDWYFPRWAFEKAYEENKVNELVDGRIAAMKDGMDGEDLVYVERMVKTAMWCLHNRAEMRPSMGKVTKMLEGTVEISEPEKPNLFYSGV